MSRPLRRYHFVMAERLGWTAKQVNKRLTLNELVEWMAFDLTRSNDWIVKYNKQKELEESRRLDREATIKAFKRLLGDRS